MQRGSAPGAEGWGLGGLMLWTLQVVALHSFVTGWPINSFTIAAVQPQSWRGWVLISFGLTVLTAPALFVNEKPATTSLLFTAWWAWSPIYVPRWGESEPPGTKRASERGCSAEDQEC